jgi:hypothetical protein
MEHSMPQLGLPQRVFLDIVAVVPEQTDRDLDVLCLAVQDAQAKLAAVLARAEVLRAARAEGRPYADIVTLEDRPLVVEMLSDVLEELAAAGAAFRRSEARVLHADGLSQEAIAVLFGVTRQRVGALLQPPKAQRKS